MCCGRHIWHAIALLSLLALGLGLASVLILIFEYRSLGIAPGFYYGSFGPAAASSNSRFALYNTFEAWRSIALSSSLSLASAAWIIGMYQAIRSQHWKWLAAIIVGASLSGVFSFLAQSLPAVSISPPFDSLLVTHPFAKVLMVATLSYLAPVVTALYSVRVLRPHAGAEPATSAPARLSLTESLNMSAADVPFEDVVFEVEELPRAQR